MFLLRRANWEEAVGENRKTPNDTVSLSGRRRPAAREQSLAVSGCDIPAPCSSKHVCRRSEGASSRCQDTLALWTHPSPGAGSLQGAAQSNYSLSQKFSFAACKGWLIVWLLLTSLIAHKLPAADQSVGPEGQSGAQHRRWERLAAVQEPWRGECRPELAHYLSVQPHRDERHKPLGLLVIHLSRKSHFPNVIVSKQGIFISRVVKGGASEKAGIHVGDRLLEVEEIFLPLFFIQIFLFS